MTTIAEEVTSAPAGQIIDWAPIKLVVFDVDGTLYDQARLRRLMLVDLLLGCFLKGDLKTIKILKQYRSLRELMADQELQNFESRLQNQVALANNTTAQDVNAAVSKWIETRPLRYLKSCRYDGVVELFDRLRNSGRKIGVLSDYPASDKVVALGLKADHVISANDPGIGVMKPNTAGLLAIMNRAGVGPDSTVVIGDRIDRDGQVALRVGANILIRSRASSGNWSTFSSYRAGIFQNF